MKMIFSFSIFAAMLSASTSFASLTDTSLQFRVILEDNFCEVGSLNNCSALAVADQVVEIDFNDDSMKRNNSSEVKKIKSSLDDRNYIEWHLQADYNPRESNQLELEILQIFVLESITIEGVTRPARLVGGTTVQLNPRPKVGSAFFQSSRYGTIQSENGPKALVSALTIDTAEKR